MCAHVPALFCKSHFILYTFIISIFTFIVLLKAEQSVLGANGCS